jgi:MerR family transcriptional regulator, redox-sensitive transcriptional activator SoxR
MRELAIGEVAREAGLSTSALRYYERAGLLPAPPRRSRQRRYTEAVFGRIYLIRLALEAGFTIGETRLFLSGFSEQTPPAARWRALAARKLQEVDALMDRARRMKLLLETSFQCRCPRLEDCEQYLRSAKRQRVGSC